MILDSATIATYQDHRMAMAFAPLALKTNLIIEEAEVVSKSYPNFWEDLKKLGFRISEI
jgi:3-phosphoshikimate 1-carboxyvinyltransferase